MARKQKPPVIELSLEDQLGWVRRIAKKVCKRHRIHGPCELDDVCQSGAVEMCRVMPRFEPELPAPDLEGAFRGYAYLFVKKACEREAERLINGGSYKSRRQVKGAPLIIGVPRSEICTPSGEVIEETSTRDMSANSWDFLRAA